MHKSNKARLWLAVIIFALVGQLAWTLGNEYLSLFVYELLKDESSVSAVNVIAIMSAASAVAGTITTWLIGAFSDKLGRRKTLICFGYIVWGLSIMSLSLIDVHTSVLLFGSANAAVITAGLIVVADCLTTIFGSSADQAGYNAWITDVSAEKKYGALIESLVSIAPLIALVILFAASMMFNEESLASWHTFLIVIGASVLIAGGLGFLFLDDSDELKKNTDNYLNDLVFGLRPKVIRKHPSFYFLLLAFFIFFLATEIFMPYLLIYLKYYINMGNAELLWLMGATVLVSSIITIGYGRACDKRGCKKLLIPAIAIYLIGLLVMFLPAISPEFASPLFVYIGLLLTLSGHFMTATSVGTMLRDETPLGHVGVYQGIRTFATVLLPGLLGSLVGIIVIHNSATYPEFGETEMVPTPWLFLASAVVLAFIIIPIAKIQKTTKKEEGKEAK